MATPIHANHAAAIVEKTNRWVDALDRMDALGVPAALNALAATGPTGQMLARGDWRHLADVVQALTGKSETAPESTRKAIASECARRADLNALKAKTA